MSFPQQVLDSVIDAFIGVFGLSRKPKAFAFALQCAIAKWKDSGNGFEDLPRFFEAELQDPMVRHRINSFGKEMLSDYEA